MRTPIFLGLLFLVVPCMAAESAKPAAESHDSLASLFKKLDSDRFEDRASAARRIESLMSEPSWKQPLANAFGRILVRADISCEVRWRVEHWTQQLPPARIDPPTDVSTDELNHLVRQLDAADYAARVGSARRLDWLLGNPKLAAAILAALKQRMADESADADARLQLEALWRRARRAWLESDAPDHDLPPVSDEQINRWLDALLRPAPDGDQHAADVGEQELLDVLIRDQYVSRLVSLIQKRLDAGHLTKDGVGRLQVLLDWTKPELAIELWRDRHLQNVQRVLVGQPTKSRGATQTIHFDRVDDRSAHSVGQHPLPSGDYPIGVAVPYPIASLAEKNFYHLVNLSTPRRRMAYAERGDEQTRLTAISRRTLARFLEEGDKLTSKQLATFGQLDPVEVSRFASKYFLAVNDATLEQKIGGIGNVRFGRKPSRFGEICRCLAADGTQDAIPGLLKAIEEKRFLPPNRSAPYAMPWLAALSIASRDPWPDVDAWLADCIDHAEPLAIGNKAAPTLDATAAALLLTRYDRRPEEFGLSPAPMPMLAQINVDGFVFRDVAAKDKMQQWWKTAKNSKPIGAMKRKSKESDAAASKKNGDQNPWNSIPMLDDDEEIVLP